MEDVEPDDTDDTDSEPDDLLDDAAEYRRKKRMSAKVFRYLMEADDVRQEELGLAIDPHLQEFWLRGLEANPRQKTDDVGDALLHALNDLLCGGSNYRQLVPPNSSLQSNRTVVVAVQPDMTYWAVLQVTWNRYELLDFGSYDSYLLKDIYRQPSTIDKIKSTLPDDLRAALTVMDSVPDGQDGQLYPTVDYIKIIVKQIKGFASAGFTNEQAGALTQSAVVAVKQLCSQSVGVGTPSILVDRHDKILGSIFILTIRSTGRKYQVVRSAGKQTNAMVAFPQWTRENAAKFMEQRHNAMNYATKVAFFDTLREIASQPDSQLEMLNLSPTARRKLIDDDSAPSVRMMIADVLLIGISKNEQHVKSVAANYRKKATPQTANDKPA